MKVWRINLKTAAEDNIDVTEFCRKRNILGVGWQVDNGFDGMDWETYYELGEQQFYYDNNDRGWWPAVNAVRNRMKINDLCWTRNSNGIYYLGRICRDWEYRSTSEYVSADVTNVRRCNWVDVGGVDAVPGKVVNSFIPSRTVQRIWDETVENFSQYLYSKLSNSDEYPSSELENGDLFSLISSADCEDLVGIYLQTKFNYTLIPSTCKKDTLGTEFVLKNDQGESAYVQVKQGYTSLNIDDFPKEQLPNSSDKWFLFSTSSNYHGREASHVICLNPTEVIEFAATHRQRMSRRVQIMIDMLGLGATGHD